MFLQGGKAMRFDPRPFISGQAYHKSYKEKFICIIRVNNKRF